MALQHLSKSIPAWVASPANTPEPVVACHCMLARNVAGFVFPNRCTEDEQRAVESRILNVLERMPGLPGGGYYKVTDMEVNAARFLAERRIVPVEFLKHARGLYISEDQSLAIIVNMDDHLLMRMLSGGGSLETLWKTLDALDTALGEGVDYAYHDRLGYLTSSLRMVGTGMKATVLLHLPAIAMLREEKRMVRLLNTRGMCLRGVTLGEPRPDGQETTKPAIAGCLAADVEPVRSQSLYMDMHGALQTEPEGTVGNLFVLSNQDTLGVSEEECCIWIDQAVSTLVQHEESCRERMLAEQRSGLMDSIGRALGIAQGARLLGMRETLSLASMIRLAAALGLVTGCNRNALNQALIECQQAHLQYTRGLPSDSRVLAGERARMFRALFAGTEMN